MSKEHLTMKEFSYEFCKYFKRVNKNMSISRENAYLIIKTLASFLVDYTVGMEVGDTFSLTGFGRFKMCERRGNTNNLKGCEPHEYVKKYLRFVPTQYIKDKVNGVWKRGMI